MENKTSQNGTSKKKKKGSNYNLQVAAGASGMGGLAFVWLNTATSGAVPGGVVGFIIGSIIGFVVIYIVLWFNFHGDEEKLEERFEQKIQQTLDKEENDKKQIEEIEKKLSQTDISPDILKSLALHQKIQLHFYLEKMNDTDIIAIVEQTKKVKLINPERWKKINEQGMADQFQLIYKRTHS